MKRIARTALGRLAILSVSAAGTALAGDFTIDRSTIDGGGVMRSAGGDFELSATIGQPDAGMMHSADTEFELAGGFWFPLATGDCNVDGGVNLLDYAGFAPCLSGPGGGLLAPSCNCFDVDNDNDVDLSDAAQFQRSVTGT